VLEDVHGPAVFSLSRQNLPVLDSARQKGVEGVPRGAYVLEEADGGAPRVALVATGSEVSLCLKARDALQAGGVPTRVVSMPSWELFADQDES